MTNEEVNAIVEAVAPVDGWCYTCGADVAKRLGELLPEWPWDELVAEAQRRYWEEDWDRKG